MEKPPYCFLFAPVYIPNSSDKGSPFLHILTNTCPLFFFNSHSNRCGVLRYLTEVLIWVLLMDHDANTRHLFMYLLPFYYYILRKVPIQGLCPFLNQIIWVFSHWVIVSFIFWALTPYQINGLLIFSLVPQATFSFCWCVLCYAKTFFICSSTYFFFLLLLVLLVSYPQNYQDQCQWAFHSMCSSTSLFEVFHLCL